MPMHLIWAQPDYEAGSDYRLASTRTAAARIVRELRDKYRDSYTSHDGRRRFAFRIVRVELEPED